LYEDLRCLREAKADEKDAPTICLEELKKNFQGEQLNPADLVNSASDFSVSSRKERYDQTSRSPLREGLIRLDGRHTHDAPGDGMLPGRSFCSTPAVSEEAISLCAGPRAYGAKSASPKL